ncbi:helix-turn-helix domain-containing protein [Kribbella solani]|uniref:Transcriptional regulator with XRE-family HTH domain n=1 Tax=Kribbella solani TaxID=236067 RepID=A0A841DVV7_9ACTN|nr:helix-turn-helix domain-containing protein [Kribbella solani]MBB5980870.1 transcriptional regulator with XRE-family HTH domain [Kribbella solani]MDX2968571.1 helix-turn-helix domain-containing protein [Kribbella solani]
MNLKDVDVQLGTAIRQLRHRQGRTLVEVAEATGLSHPFLSQVERGRARPSMRSLFLIAEALGTTQQSLLASVSPMPEAAEPPLLGEGTRLLLHQEGVDVTEFSEIGTEYEEFFKHARPEFLYVVTGHLELETREPGDATSTFTTLAPRDSATYPGNTQHRFRRLTPEPCTVLMIHGDHHP